LQLRFCHIEHRHIRITLVRLRCGRIGLDGRRRSARRRCSRRARRDRATLGLPFHGLERHGDILRPDAEEAADTDDDGLSVAVMIDEHVLDLSDFLLVSAHDRYADELRSPPLIDRLLLYKWIARRLLRHRGRHDEGPAEQGGKAELLEHLNLLSPRFNPSQHLGARVGSVRTDQNSTRSPAASPSRAQSVDKRP
jgi:hypothetical protein